MDTSNKNREDKIFKLTGQVTYVEWLRLFKREARNEELLDILTGVEHCRTTEPTLQSASILKAKTGPNTRSKDGVVITDDFDAALTMINYQDMTKKLNDNREKQKRARKLLFKWVSENIIMEIENLENPVLMFAQIKKQYGLSTEKIQEDVISKLDNLRLDDCSSMADYISKHRAMKADLTAAEYVYSNTQYNTNILRGLGNKYERFRNQWKWFLETKPDRVADPAELHRKLLEEETDLDRQNERRKANRPANVQISGNTNVYVKKEPKEQKSRPFKKMHLRTMWKNRSHYRRMLEERQVIDAATHQGRN